MPFQDHANTFAPGDLEVMTAAFNTVTKSSPRPLTNNEKAALAQRIMESAADGVVDIGPLTRVALAQLARFEPTLGARSDSDVRRFRLAFWARGVAPGEESSTARLTLRSRGSTAQGQNQQDESNGTPALQTG